MKREKECQAKQAIRFGMVVWESYLLSAFAMLLLGVSGCSSFVSCRDERSVTFEQDDANHLVFEVVRSLATSRVFSRADGRRNVVVVDALDVSSVDGRKDVVAVGRAFDVNLRKELMDSGRFFVCDADDRSPSAQKIVPQYRFTGKLSRLAVGEGGAELTLSAAVADISTGQVVWSKKASVGKRVRKQK